MAGSASAEDFHLPAIAHAGRINKTGGLGPASLFYFYYPLRRSYLWDRKVKGLHQEHRHLGSVYALFRAVLRWAAAGGYPLLG